jgi:hypothetical protein
LGCTSMSRENLLVVMQSLAPKKAPFIDSGSEVRDQYVELTKSH